MLCENTPGGRGGTVPPCPPLTAGTSGCGEPRRPRRSWSRSSRVPRTPRHPGPAAGGAEQGLGARGPAPASPALGSAWRKVTVSAGVGLEWPSGASAHPDPLTCAVPTPQPRLSQARSSSRQCRLRERRALSPPSPGTAVGCPRGTPQRAQQGGKRRDRQRGGRVPAARAASPRAGPGGWAQPGGRRRVPHTCPGGSGHPDATAAPGAPR